LLTANTGGSFQHVLRVPSGLKGIRIQRVSVLPVEPTTQVQAGIDQVASWSDDGEGSVTAFLSRRSSGRQRLVFEGRLPIAPAGSFVLPVFTLEGGEIVRRRFHIDRHSGLNLRVQGSAGLVQVPDDPTVEDSAKAGGESINPVQERPPEPPSVEGPSRSPARRVGTWSALASATGVVSWQANEPNVTAALMMTLRPRTETAWDTQLDARLTVDQGVLDAVRFDIPDAWTDRISISPPSPFHWQSKGSGVRRLVFRPSSPIAGDYRIRLSGQITANADKLAPLPELVGATTQNRWLVLPTEWKSQRVIWERRGLRETNFPSGFDPPADGNVKFVPFEVLGAASQAIWKSYTPAQSEPTVALADVWIDRRDSQSYIGSVGFDLLPAGRSYCVLEVPRGARVLQARLGDIPVLPAPLDETAQRIDFGATYLPQTITVHFAVTGDSDSSSRRVAAPWIREWPVQRTLWTTNHAAPPRAEWLTPTDADGRATALDQWHARTETFSRLMQIAAQQSQADALLWEPAWRRRLVLAKAHENAHARPTGARWVGTHEYVAIDLGEDSQSDFENRFGSLAIQHQATLLGALDGRAVCEVPRAQRDALGEAVHTAWPKAQWQPLPAPPSVLPDTISAAGIGGRHSTHWMWDHGVSSIELDPSRLVDSHFWGRWMALGVMCAGVASVLFARRRGWTLGNLMISPNLLLALVGLFWWLYLWPSWLGLILLFAAVWSALRFPWQSKVTG
jgi:hypothetical protein